MARGATRGRHGWEEAATGGPEQQRPQGLPIVTRPPPPACVPSPPQHVYSAAVSFPPCRPSAGASPSACTPSSPTPTAASSAPRRPAQPAHSPGPTPRLTRPPPPPPPPPHNSLREPEDWPTWDPYLTDEPHLHTFPKLVETFFRGKSVIFTGDSVNIQVFQAAVRRAALPLPPAAPAAPRTLGPGARLRRGRRQGAPRRGVRAAYLRFALPQSSPAERLLPAVCSYAAQICEAAREYDLTHVTHYLSGPPEDDPKWAKKFAVRSPVTLRERPAAGVGDKRLAASRRHHPTSPQPRPAAQTFFFELHTLTQQDLTEPGSVWKGGPVMGTEARHPCRAAPSLLPPDRARAPSLSLTRASPASNLPQHPNPPTSDHRQDQDLPLPQGVAPLQPHGHGGPDAAGGHPHRQLRPPLRGRAGAVREGPRGALPHGAQRGGAAGPLPTARVLRSLARLLPLCCCFAAGGGDGRAVRGARRPS